MISIEQISGEIAALEEEKPTHVLMQKLANLYTVRDHMVIDSEPVVSSAVVVSTIPDMMSDTEFANLVVGKSTNNVMSIIDELMSTLQVINPKLYNSVIQKL